MKIKKRFFVTIIQFLLLIDSIKQSKIRQTTMAYKAFSSTLNKPIIKTIGNTIKKSIGMLRRNNIKNLVFGLEKAGVNKLRTKYNFGSKYIHDLGKEGILNYKAHWIIKGNNDLFRVESKKNIQIKSIQMMGVKRKEIRSLIRRSASLIGGKDLISLVNMIPRNKGQIPFLVGGYVMRHTKFNIVPDQLDADIIPPANKKEIGMNDSVEITKKKPKKKNLTIKKSDLKGDLETNDTDSKTSVKKTKVSVKRPKVSDSKSSAIKPKASVKRPKVSDSKSSAIKPEASVKRPKVSDSKSSTIKPKVSNTSPKTTKKKSKVTDTVSKVESKVTDTVSKVKLSPKEKLALLEADFQRYHENFKESVVLTTFWGYKVRIKQFVRDTQADLKKKIKKTYTLFFDGAAKGNPGPAGAGFALKNEKGEVVGEFWSYLGPSLTNNLAEYAGLTMGQIISRMIGIENLEVRSDSKLVISQLSGAWRIKNDNMKKLNADVKKIVKEYEKVSMEHVPREQNEIADKLANRGIEEYVRAQYRRSYY